MESLAVSRAVRVIYYNRLANGEIVLLFIYAKNEFDSIAGEKLKELKMLSKKPMDDKALRAWEDSRDLAAELEQSINEMLAGQGKAVAVSPVVAVRMQSGLSQSLFAKLLGVSVRTLQEWEQGRRKPSGAANPAHNCTAAP
jgi:putative transcriptional regulator